MTDIPQNVLDRIRKCLALAASPNPGEAETAMAHARKLMEKYGIEKADLELSEIGETEDIKASHLNSAWMASLIHTVDDLLGTSTIAWTTTDPWTGRNSTRKVRIYGPKAKLELAEYLFTVLRRQILKDRRSYFKELVEGKDTWWYDTPQKTALADAFCQQWIDTVEDRIRHLFVTRSPIVEEYKQRYVKGLRTYTTHNKSHFLTTDEDIENAQNQGKAFGENADIFLAMGKYKDAEAVGLSRLSLNHKK